MGELDSALGIYAELVPAMRTVFPAPEPTLSTVLASYAKALALRARTTEAVELYRESIDGFRRTVGPEHSRTQQREKALEQLLASTNNRSPR